MSKVIVLGARGQLGTAFQKLVWNGKKDSLIPFSREDLDVCDYNRVRSVLSEAKPDVVINTSAFHQVDRCEDEVEMAFKVNAYAVRNLAFICRDLNCIFVHFSTDYVFDGTKTRPYTEEDVPNPLSVYATSKLAGEHFARLCPRHYVVRTCGLYGRSDSESGSATTASGGKGGNFVSRILRWAKEGKPLQVVHDQVLTPTSTGGVAAKVQQLLQTDAFGLYHITDEGECSWYEFAKTVFEFAGVKPDFSPVSSKEFGAKARRPVYSVLKNDMLEKRGISDMPHWKDALMAYIQEIQN